MSIYPASAALTLSPNALLVVVPKRWLEFPREIKFPMPPCNLNVTLFLPQLYLT